MAIPIIVIAWNNLTFVKSFINQIQHLTDKIIIMDNASTYSPMFEYYDTLEKLNPNKYEIRRLDKNYGHNVCYTFIDTLPDTFCMSDPDLQLNPKMPHNLIEQLIYISNTYHCGKVGLALDITDHELFIPGNCHDLVYSIESGYYKNKIVSDNYEMYYAPIDTTFCLINKKFNIELAQNNIRVAGLFTAKHLPWYDNYLINHIPNDELRVWIQNNRSSCILPYIDVDKIMKDD
jgi:hypothetical protein